VAVSVYSSFEEFWSDLLDKGGWWDPAYLGAEHKILIPLLENLNSLQFLKKDLNALSGGVTIKSVDQEDKLEEILRELKIEARGIRFLWPITGQQRLPGMKMSIHFISVLTNRWPLLGTGLISPIF
jgi:hypothetical protein